MGILIALLAFALMVFIHEFGHFISAKLFKIKVLEFAIGMGPAIFKKKMGETLYSVRVLPIGGYCSMEGEDSQSDDERSFGRAKWWKRFIVVIAGAVLNIFLGFVLLFSVEAGQKQAVLPVIDRIESYSDMLDAGFKSGDRIIKIDGSRINIYEDLSFSLDRVGGKETEVWVKRGNEIIKSKVTPVKEEVIYKYQKDKTIAERYIDGMLVGTYETGATTDESYLGKEERSERYILGFDCETEENTIFHSLKRSFFLTGFYVKLVYVSLFELISGNIPANQISGPVGVVSIIGEASKVDISFLFSILALLTVNLGVMNLLPIPALDGCKMIIILIEAITKKKVPPEKEGIINLIGFAILIGIMIFATYNDIARLFSGA